jgi:uncharacterized protein (TIGR01777 family)
MAQTILITGATGLIGRNIIKTLLQRDYDIIALTRNISQARKMLPQISKFVSWNDYISLYSEKFSAVINLAGTNLGARRWGNKFKREIYDSRILTTRKIIYLISKMSLKPEVLINSSGVDCYGDTGDKEIDESFPYADTFIAKLVRDWEMEALDAKKYNVRVVCLRTGFVIAPDSTSLSKMAVPFKFFIGGYPGSGKQFLSWIDIEDLVSIYLFCLENKSISGAVNAASPYPETMRQFSKQLGKILHRPSIFPVPPFVLRILFGEAADLMISGRKALPKKLLQAGYNFKYEHAIDSLKKAWSP